MMNNIKKFTIGFSAIIIFVFSFISNEVNAARLEIKPTSTQVSPQNNNLRMMYLPDQINQIILKHMLYREVNPRIIPGMGYGFQWQSVIYTNIGINQGGFRIETPAGSSLTISSPKWFQIRIVQAQIRETNVTFPMPVVEYKVEDVENPPSVIIEYSDTSIEIRPTRVELSPEFPNLLVRYFLSDVNHAVREYLRRSKDDEFSTVVSPWQSDMHKMIEVSNIGGEVIIPFGSGHISISSCKWFRVRIMKTRVNGRPGIIYYSPIIEYKKEDIENAPKVVFNNVRDESRKVLPEYDGFCQEECPVCLEVMKVDNITLPCGHKFCRGCIAHWIEECRNGVRFDVETAVDGREDDVVAIEDQSAPKDPECPICRRPFKV